MSVASKVPGKEVFYRNGRFEVIPLASGEERVWNRLGDSSNYGVTVDGGSILSLCATIDF
jgi:hypothetical protein